VNNIYSSWFGELLGGNIYDVGEDGGRKGVVFRLSMSGWMDGSTFDSAFMPVCRGALPLSSDILLFYFPRYNFLCML
jgi:hypothetical protein